MGNKISKITIRNYGAYYNESSDSFGARKINSSYTLLFRVLFLFSLG